VYFTLAVSAATSGACAALTAAAGRTDPRVMPIPGPAWVAWRAPDGRAAILHWGEAHRPGTSHAGTIWAEGAMVRARTGLARVDPVYLAEQAGAAVVSDRASWVAAATGRLHDPDLALIGAFLNLGYPVGSATPFRGVRALDGDRALRAAGGRLTVSPVRVEESPGGPDRVAAALTEAVRPLREAAAPVVLSLTGGKDSRLVAAALAAARVPFAARTHGFASHPDVAVAGLIADRLGVEHTVTAPAAPGTPDEADVLARLRAAVLVSDGMLSAFENVGRPDPPSGAGPTEAGGHGGDCADRSAGIRPGRLAARLRRGGGPFPARLRPGPQRGESVVRHGAAAGRRAVAVLTACGSAGDLGAGHPGRVAVRRLAQRARGLSGQRDQEGYRRRCGQGRSKPARPQRAGAAVPGGPGLILDVPGGRCG
jgi:hypothetical protein